MRSLGILVSMFCAGLMACGYEDTGRKTTGGSGGSGALPIPLTYRLAQSQSASFSPGGFYGFSFILPKPATFHFSASETTTDSWNVAVFTPAQWVSYQTGSSNQAYDGVHNGVMQVSDTVSLPAGDWYLGFRCANAFQRCMLIFNAEATY